jgi:outer membrane protein, multidrug efflux system
MSPPDRSPKLRTKVTSRISVLLLIALQLSACTVSKNYLAPVPELPKRLANKTNAIGTQLPETNWWNAFGDPGLSRLVEKALQDNLDVRAAELRLKQSRASAGQLNVALYPSIDGSSSAKQSRDGGTQTRTATFNYSLDVSWEIDLWGGKKRDREAVLARVDQADSDVNAAKISIVAELATAYSDLVLAKARRSIIEASIASKQKSLELAKVKFEGGLTVESDVLRAKAALSDNQAQLPETEFTIARNAYRIAILTGQSIENVNVSPNTANRIPRFRKKLYTGIPADFARRRPDIVKLERDLAIASAEIGVATADLYPKLTLVGSIGGSESRSAGTTISAPGTWSFGPSLSLPIFDAGRRKNNLSAKKVRFDEALVNWKLGVMKAVEEIEIAQLNCRLENEKLQALVKSRDSNRKVLKQSRELYDQGLSSFSEVLDAERSILTAELAIAESEAQIMRNVISVYKALGGAW